MGVGMLQPGTLVLFALLLLVVFFLVLRALWRVGNKPQQPAEPPDAVEIARRRYARGEISRVEYERLLADLTQARQ